MAKRVVLAGGGTGGHLYPLIAVTEHLRQTYGKTQPIDFRYLGPTSKLERTLMKQYKIPFNTVMAGKLRRYASIHYLLDLIKAPIGFLQALVYMFIFMPDVVFAKGGYASVPVAMVARLYRIPVVIHESDAFPGMANRYLGSICQKVAICFDRARIHFPSSKTVLTGTPVRNDAINGDPMKARKMLDLPDLGKPVILFIGGSQGAKALNDEVIEIVDELVARYQVVHITGPEHLETVKQLIRDNEGDPESNLYRAVAYVHEGMNDLFALADVVISRAGATTISEIAANQKPTILVPISDSANDHQRINAFEVAKAGGAIVLEQENFKRGILLHNINNILTDTRLRESLVQHITQFYYPNAAEAIGQEIRAFL